MPDVAENLQDTPDPLERLTEVLSHADAELIAVLARLQRLRAELGHLVTARLRRQWSPDEFVRYLALTAEERRAHRRYVAARRVHDAAFRRFRRILADD